MKRQFVEHLQEGDVLNDYYTAVRKDLRDTQAGGKFLGLVFKDRTGDIGGVLWNNAESVASRFELGDVVNVRGTVNTYQGRLQVRVDQILPLKDDEYDLADLVYTPEDAEAVSAKFFDIVKTVADPWLAKLVAAFLDDQDFVKRFIGAGAGKKWHHSFPGGLVQHCYEMARIAEVMCELFPKIDRDMLMTGVFVHDIGKIEELSQGMYIDYTDAGKLLGHLELGAAMAHRKMDAIEGFPENLRLQIVHLILSHHAELENGSPVVPKTLEAIALAHIDNLDAQTDAFTRVIEETKARRQTWSEYINMIQRQIWTKGQ